MSLLREKYFIACSTVDLIIVRHSLNILQVIFALTFISHLGNLQELYTHKCFNQDAKCVSV